MSPRNIAVIGYGFSAKIFHIPFIQHNPNLTLSAIIQRNPTPGNDAAEDHPDVKVYRSIEEFYKGDSESELVVVTTSNDTHFQYCKEAIENGKNVIVEKPLTIRSVDAEELVRLAKEKGVGISVYQNRRFDSDFLTLVKVLPRVGDLVSLETHYDRYKPDTTPDASKPWKSAQVPGNGTLFDLGVHLLDQVVHLFGMPQRLFGDVRDERGCSTNPFSTWGQEGFVDDFFTAILYYNSTPQHKKPFTVRVEASTLSCQTPQLRFVLRGVDGSWIKHNLDTQEAQLKAGRMPGTEGFGAEEEEHFGTLELKDGSVERTVAEVGDYGKFYEKIAEGGVAVPAEEAVRVIKLVELIGESSRLGGILDISV
ncbi:NAD(P)-binding protein [Choiromyces venosus 120613-1]|uniref:NAD(P)-binding protein n=1 Tax=Choiromyces venosus 120613-1 TaxID=1336337 RepID=A0A3N4JSR8_9PEZI|nr:NAD(P)-binding protein [Choiromyces venosus 120613-1]